MGRKVEKLKAPKSYRELCYHLHRLIIDYPCILLFLCII